LGRKEIATRVTVIADLLGHATRQRQRVSSKRKKNLGVQLERTKETTILGKRTGGENDYPDIIGDVRNNFFGKRCWPQTMINNAAMNNGF